MDYFNINNTIFIVINIAIIFQRFVGNPLFEDIRKRAVFVHVDLPGQEDDAEAMGDDAPFPTMQVFLDLLRHYDSLSIKMIKNVVIENTIVYFFLNLGTWRRSNYGT